MTAGLASGSMEGVSRSDHRRYRSAEPYPLVWHESLAAVGPNGIEVTAMCCMRLRRGPIRVPDRIHKKSGTLVSPW